VIALPVIVVGALLLVRWSVNHWSPPTGTGGRAKTWVTLTPSWPEAFDGHLRILQQMAAAALPVT
jgi:hypothetical protein